MKQPDWEKIGNLKIELRKWLHRLLILKKSPIRRLSKHPLPDFRPFNKDSENVIEHDWSVDDGSQDEGDAEQEISRKNLSESKSARFFAKTFNRQKKTVTTNKQPDKRKHSLLYNVRSNNTLVRLAYSLLANHIPRLTEFRKAYSQSGISLIYDAYLSTGILVSCFAGIGALTISLLVELLTIPRPSIVLSLVGSLVLCGITFGIAFFLWLSYPTLRRRTYKSKLENHLAYSFGILGVLAAAGMGLDRLFERIAMSESNVVLASLASRFLRNVKVFGMDTEAALVDVAEHSPSQSFARMLDSISVAYKTTGSIHNLVMFESSRLLQEKSDKLRKTIGSLAVMAELYITLVVVGPIIFIVMMAIFGLLPAGGLPNPISIINLIVFIGIPILSMMFVLLLDSVVAKA